MDWMKIPWIATTYRLTLRIGAVSRDYEPLIVFGATHRVNLSLVMSKSISIFSLFVLFASTVSQVASSPSLAIETYIQASVAKNETSAINRPAPSEQRVGSKAPLRAACSAPTRSDSETGPDHWRLFRLAFRELQPERYLEPAAAQRLHALNMPILANVGELDIPDFRQITDLICEHVSQAEKLMVPGVGHISKQVTDAILDFLKNTEISRS